MLVHLPTIDRRSLSAATRPRRKCAEDLGLLGFKDKLIPMVLRSTFEYSVRAEQNR